jgi:RNA polymerase sigma-70 factor, ECF subfamily
MLAGNREVGRIASPGVDFRAGPMKSRPYLFRQRPAGSAATSKGAESTRSDHAWPAAAFARLGLEIVTTELGLMKNYSSSDRPPTVASIEDRVESLVSSSDAQAEVELMAAVAANDPSAQRVVAQRLAPRVRRVAGLLCRNPADADDAAQASLIEILRSAGSFRVATSLERWADRVTVRTTLRTVRRERSRRGLLERWVPADLLPWGTHAVQSAVEAVNLDTLLKRLSHERFEAFVLHHALDYTVDEIAELTGAPVGTVKDRLVVARKQLRKLLRGEARSRQDQ